MSWKTKLGGTAYKLNVTSLQWGDESIYTIANNTNGTWWHEVLVIVPTTLKFRNVSLFYGTGRYNDRSPMTGDVSDQDEEILDALAHEGMMIGVVGYQMPNAHMVFKADPD